jgi:hypothetical protein
MHDPSTLLFDVRPIRLDIWHDDPDGHDAGTVCGNPPMTLPGSILWGIRHLHYRFWPYLKVRRWIRDLAERICALLNPCTDCGKPSQCGELWCVDRELQGNWLTDETVSPETIASVMTIADTPFWGES